MDKNNKYAKGGKQITILSHLRERQTDEWWKDIFLGVRIPSTIVSRLGRWRHCDWRIGVFSVVFGGKRFGR